MKTLITSILAIILLISLSSIEYNNDSPTDPVWEYCKAEYNMTYDYYLDVFIETDEYTDLYNSLMEEPY